MGGLLVVNKYCVHIFHTNFMCGCGGGGGLGMKSTLAQSINQTCLGILLTNLVNLLQATEASAGEELVCKLVYRIKRSNKQRAAMVRSSSVTAFCCFPRII